MRNVNVYPFIATGNTITIAATGSSSTTAIAGFRALDAESPGNIRVYNAGPDIAWVKLRTLVEGARLASKSLWPD